MIPFELVFNPNWWNKNCGISFEKPFYFDAETREKDDVIMRKVLYDRFGNMGQGEKNPQTRPVIGSLYVAGGFVVPALMGSGVKFSPAEAPVPLTKIFSPEGIQNYQRPDFLKTWPMDELIKSWDEQEKHYGYLCGDLCTDGLLNTAYHFMGPDLFSEMLTDPDSVRPFLRQIGLLTAEVANYVHSRTGTFSISVNRAAAHLSPSPFILSNCSVQMISPRLYEKVHMPIEREMSEMIHPYGIHHCGVHMEKYAAGYQKIPPVFCDVGWESDPGKCRAELPDAFLNLRLSPIRMLNCSPDEMAADTEYLLSSVGALDNVGVCCINMDYGTPDENIRAVYEVVEKYRKIASERKAS